VKKYPINMSFTFSHILKTLNTGGLNYLGNSLIIALLTSVIGTICAFGTAYFSARSPGKTSKFLHMIAITTLAIPGLVLGLSYMLFFKGTFIYATFAILILVNTMHFFSSPYLMAYNSFSKINMNLEAVAQTLGITKTLLTKDVLIPQMKNTILEMFSYFFVNSMMTISAVSFLATAQNKPLSLMINLFQAQMIVEGAAFVSLTILTVNILMKFIIYILAKKLNN
jgi:iron(III) transport system permease protein